MLHESEYPIVILDADGVVDRVATQDEANEYVASMPLENLRWERTEPAEEARRPRKGA